MSRPRATRRRLLEFALGLPGAYLDHPWGEDVTKVNKKVFVFFGEETTRSGMSVKLKESLDQALSVAGVAPTGYGLGRAGWVDVPFAAGAPPLAVLKDWVEESYRIVAPKRLVAELDARPQRR
jgi:predicted DNA-binding protein (MmcQ/YjbR family)